MELLLQRAQQLLGLSSIALAHKAFAYATAKQEKQPQIIRFKCYDGSVEVLPAAAQKFGFVRDTLKDGIMFLEADKAAEFDITIFSEYAPSKESLQLLIACIENPTFINRMSIDQIDSLLSSIAVMCPPKDICNAIIARENSLKNSPDSPDYIIFQKQTLLNHEKIKNVAKEDKVILDLRNKGLASLNGLAQVASDDVCAINLSNNKLLSLDLAKMKEYFPNLLFVIARNNKIKKLTACDIAASKGLVVDLDSNEIASIEKITIFNDAPENGIIILNNNPLSKEAQKNIKSALMPSAWQKIRGTLSLKCNAVAQKIQTLNTFLGMGNISLGDIHISIPAGIINWLFNINNKKYKEQFIKEVNAASFENNVTIIGGGRIAVTHHNSLSSENIKELKKIIINSIETYYSSDNVLGVTSLACLPGILIDKIVFAKEPSNSVLAHVCLLTNWARSPFLYDDLIEYLKDKPDVTKYYLLLAALPTALSACSYLCKNLSEFKPTILHMAQAKSPQKPKKTTSFADLD